MSLQEVFYLVAIIFMSVMLILMIICAILSFDLLNQLRKIARTTQEFVDSASEKGHRILDRAEDVIPKLVETISIGKHIKEAIKQWKKK